MEPALGFEPRTDGLQNRSSTAELSRRHAFPGGIGVDGAGRPDTSGRIGGSVDAGMSGAVVWTPIARTCISTLLIWHIFFKSQPLSLSFLRFRDIV